MQDYRDEPAGATKIPGGGPAPALVSETFGVNELRIAGYELKSETGNTPDGNDMKCGG
jgi:hypothetical protein